MKFHRRLNQTGRRRADDPPEVGIVDYSAHSLRAIKLRVIEYIERLDANVQRLGFPQESHALADLHIEILYTRALKNAPRRIAELPQRFRSESVRIECVRVVTRIGIEL